MRGLHLIQTLDSADVNFVPVQERESYCGQQMGGIQNSTGRPDRRSRSHLFDYGDIV